MAGPLKGYQWSVSRSYDYITGTNEPAAVMDEFCSWLGSNTVFYDIGSNIGYYSFIANTFISTGKIYAIEPTAFNNELFQQLMLINKKKLPHNTIQVCAFAIADTAKEVMFSNNIVFAEGNSYVPVANDDKAEKIKVQCYSIDGLLQMGYAIPDVIKIDVEGAEYDALVGATATLQKYKPNLLLATHDCIVPGIKERSVQYLEGLGYIVKHTGYHNKSMAGLDDYIAVHKDKLKR
ncbi:FkbM family methyltransferase [Ferruginibacter sp. SUN106]|uniref:FkbM family methyltransferase n=1 Tax=Ferruginibacter sp. SUN106 TaxID=2978348 RepID=UPI003D365838